MISKFIIALIIIALLMAIILMGRLIYKYHLYPRMRWGTAVCIFIIVLCVYCIGNLLYSNLIYKPTLPTLPTPPSEIIWNAAIRMGVATQEDYNQQVAELTKPYLNPFIPRH